MKIRHMNHRDFRIAPAGFYNLLQPSKRFTSSIPPGDFPYLPSQFKGAAPPQIHDTPAPQLDLLSTHQSLPQLILRFAVIIVAAIALTFFFLWWSAGFPLHITFFPDS
jgi:hypothetical protein